LELSFMDVNMAGLDGVDPHAPGDHGADRMIRQPTLGYAPSPSALAWEEPQRP
jgi:hypothetical protein